MDFTCAESVNLLFERIESEPNPIRRALEANSFAHQAKDNGFPKLASRLFRMKIAATCEARILGLATFMLDPRTKMIILRYWRNGEPVRAALHLPIDPFEKFVRENYRVPDWRNCQKVPTNAEEIEHQRELLLYEVRKAREAIKIQEQRRKRRRRRK